MDAFTVLVADPSQTPQSRAVLECLWRWARRSHGRSLHILFEHAAPTADPETPWRSGAKAVILLLLERQTGAAERLLSSWNAADPDHENGQPVLPILISARGSESLSHLATERSNGAALRPLIIPEEEIHVEHGGLFRLSAAAEFTLREALQALTPPRPTPPGDFALAACPCAHAEPVGIAA